MGGRPQPPSYLAFPLTQALWISFPVVSYGGISGGLRAVEALRLVFAELHMVTLRDTVSFAFAAKKFDEEGRLLDDEIPNDAAGALLNRLDRWGRALRRARADEPYRK